MALEATLNTLIKECKADTNQISDGYHTFGQLYDHRIALFLALCRVINNCCDLTTEQASVWLSRFHSDGTSFEDWFIMGITFEDKQGLKKQISYHLPMSDYIRATDIVHPRFQLDKAPEWDGHTPDDVVVRLEEIGS